jgi:hypothetical protein
MSGRAARSVTPGRPLITQQRRLSLELLAGKMIEFAMVINADDAKLFEMIEQCAAVWREAMRLDEATVKVRRSGGDPAKSLKRGLLNLSARPAAWNGRSRFSMSPAGLATKRRLAQSGWPISTTAIS